MSVRAVAAGSSLGLGGAIGGHGPTWLVATSILVILGSTLAAAEIGSAAPIRRLVRLLRSLG